MPGHSGTPVAGTPDGAGSESPVWGLTAPPVAGIRRLSALETVRARIALAVDLGLLTPGERLPPSDRIAAALDVGEITVRRALASLHADGLLERRRGRGGGTLVAERPSRRAVAEVEAYRSVAAEVHHLVDHRLVLECGIAHLAATNADHSTLDVLDQLVEDMDRAPSWAEFHGCDERFHLAVAAATGISSATGPYGAVLRELHRYFLPYPMQALRESNCEHRTLVDAIRRGDPAAAADIARRHVDVLHRTMFVGLMGGD